MKIQKEKLIIILTVLIDVIGLGIVIPVMPFYVQSFGVSVLFVTLLFSVFALFSFFSAPLLGALSDRFGRRPILIISILSTAIGWFVFAGAKVVWVLFLARIIDGIAAGNFPIAQSYLVDIARNPKERSTNMGIIGATFGIGFIVGPMLGGLLSVYSNTLPFYFVGFLATINLIGVFFFLPETKKFNKDHVSLPLNFNPLKPLLNAIKDLALRSRYLTWFLFNLAAAIQQSVFALYLNDVFGFKVAVVGYVMTVIGVTMAINQGFLLKNFWFKYFKESRLEIWLFLLFALGYLMLASNNLIIFFAGLLPMILGQSVLRVVISSRSAGIAGPSRRGEVMGIMSSIQSLAAIIGPLGAGIIYLYSKNLAFLLAAAILVIGFCVTKYICQKHGDIHDDEAGIVEAIS